VTRHERPDSIIDFVIGLVAVSAFILAAGLVVGLAVGA
jgi:hypothetical protein